VGDTSALYAVFDADDEHHEEAKRALEEPEPVVAPTEILTETVDLIGYHASHDLARQALDWLLERPNVRVADPVHVPAVRDIHSTAEGKLSLADALVVQTCRALGADLLAFDAAIEKRVT
jgi:predicted nucleic acid-binding protein